MSLLNDLDEEYHADLLQNGNLRPKRQSWTGENQWTSLGYEAHITHTSCKCGYSAKTLTGIFHTERTPSGSTRHQSLKLDTFLQFPPDQIYTILTEQKVKICPSCLTTKGD